MKAYGRPKSCSPFNGYPEKYWDAADIRLFLPQGYRLRNKKKLRRHHKKIARVEAKHIIKQELDFG